MHIGHGRQLALNQISIPGPEVLMKELVTKLADADASCLPVIVASEATKWV